MGSAEGVGSDYRRNKMGLSLFPRAVGGYPLDFRRIDLLRRSGWIHHGFRRPDRQGPLASEYRESDSHFADNIYGEWTAIHHDAFRIGCSDLRPALVTLSWSGEFFGCIVQHQDPIALGRRSELFFSGGRNRSG